MGIRCIQPPRWWSMGLETSIQVGMLIFISIFFVYLIFRRIAYGPPSTPHHLKTAWKEPKWRFATHPFLPTITHFDHCQLFHPTGGPGIFFRNYPFFFFMILVIDSPTINHFDVPSLVWTTTTVWRMTVHDGRLFKNPHRSFSGPTASFHPFWAPAARFQPPPPFLSLLQPFSASTGRFPPLPHNFCLCRQVLRWGGT